MNKRIFVPIPVRCLWVQQEDGHYFHESYDDAAERTLEHMLTRFPSARRAPNTATKVSEEDFRWVNYSVDSVEWDRFLQGSTANE